MNDFLENVFKKAVNFHNLNNLKKAIKMYEKVLKFNPSHKLALINLANIFDQIGDLSKSKNNLEKLFFFDNNNSEIIFRLAVIYFRLNDTRNSILYFDKIIDVEPNFKNLRYNLLNIIRSEKFLNLKKTHYHILKKIFLFLLRHNDVDHSLIANSVLSFLYDKNELISNFKKKNIISSNFFINLAEQEIFQLVLQKIIITDQYLEEFLTSIRKKFILEDFVEIQIKNSNNLNFLISLAEQCWLNEYIWFLNEDEKKKIKFLKNKIEESNEINEKEIALLACYISLDSSQIIRQKLLKYKSQNKLFNDLINLQIVEPNTELLIKKKIKSLSSSINTVSKSVREQYEENPYPRWRYCNQLSLVDFNQDLNFQISPNRFYFQNKKKNLDILLAGCGTGKHLVTIAKFKNSKILALDLSLSSLAYAKRKVDEFGYKNIEFLHSDILDLNKLDKKFDVIHSVGTLHHMEYPLDGLKKLYDILRVDGILRLGLYSELARKEVIDLKKIIKLKEYKDNIDDIKLFRKFILAENKSSALYKSIFNKDFYSTSSIRDLLFHTKEHQFTIPKIIKIINDFNFEFLGFVFSNNKIKHEYSKIFPNDIKNINLDNWNKFELKYPYTFISMYQFFVKKN